MRAAPESRDSGSSPVLPGESDSEVEISIGFLGLCQSLTVACASGLQCSDSELLDCDLTQSRSCESESAG